MSKCAIFGSSEEAFSSIPEGVYCGVYKVSGGYQVVPITVCQPYVPPRVPIPVSSRNVICAARPAPVQVRTVEVCIEVREMSPKYVGFVKPDGTIGWMGRSKFDVLTVDGCMQRVSMEEGYAKARGFV